MVIVKENKFRNRLLSVKCVVRNIEVFLIKEMLLSIVVMIIKLNNNVIMFRKYLIVLSDCVLL